MGFELDEVEARVLGSLLEKEATTPEYYPLSLNALVNACNQKSNREPVVSYDEDTVEEALARLRSKGLATRITGPEVRVPKHAQRLSEVLNLGRRENAVVCVLLLRGPQTLGELRSRAERMYPFEDLSGVESCLNRLMEQEPEPLVKKMARQSGFKEARYVHLLSGEVEAVPPPPERVQAAAPEGDRLARMEAAIARLEQQIADLQQKFERFRQQFE